jgi:hypothetical protein
MLATRVSGKQSIREFYRTLNPDEMKALTNEELAGYLAASCQTGAINGVLHLRMEQVIRLCREVVAEDRK